MYSMIHSISCLMKLLCGMPLSTFDKLFEIKVMGIINYGGTMFTPLSVYNLFRVKTFDVAEITHVKLPHSCLTNYILSTV